MHSPRPGGRPLLTTRVVLWNVLSGRAWVLTAGIASSEVCSSSTLVIARIALTRHTLARVTSIHTRPTHPLAPSHHVLLLLLCLLLLPLGLGHVAGVSCLLLARVASPGCHHAGVTRLSPPARRITRGATRRAIARGILAWLGLSVVSGIALLARKLVMLGMVVCTRGLLLLLLMLLLLLLLLVFTTAPEQLQILTSRGLAAVICHLICCGAKVSQVSKTVKTSQVIPEYFGEVFHYVVLDSLPSCVAI